MAESKRAQAEADEKYVLPVPPFEPETYVRREVIFARAAVVLALYGLVLGQLAAILYLMQNQAIFALVALLAGLWLMKPVLEAMGVSTEGWDKKTWLTHGSLLFFTWLAAWILFTNPPFVG